MLAYQVNDDIVQGRFPLNRDLALELTSLLAQVSGGDRGTVRNTYVIGCL